MTPAESSDLRIPVPDLSADPDKVVAHLDGLALIGRYSSRDENHDGRHKVSMS